MEKVPKEVKLLILAELDPGSYVSAIESSPYWPLDETQREEKKSCYVSEKKREDRAQRVAETITEVRDMFNSDEAPMRGFGAIFESQSFMGLVTSVMEKVFEVTDDDPDAASELITGNGVSSLLSQHDFGGVLDNIKLETGPLFEQVLDLNETPPK